MKLKTNIKAGRPKP